MFMKNALNSASRFWFSRSLGILLIRLEVGFIFLTHGLSKVENIHRTMMMFAGMGMPMWVGAFIAWLEVIGGAALILGILTRIFAVAFGIEMMVAVFLSLGHAGMGGMGSGWESTIGGTEFFLSIASFAIALMGSGKYSLWKQECHSCGGMFCKPGQACPGPKNV